MAYDSVKALKHGSLHTMDEEGKHATPKGVQTLLDALKAAIQTERPVKTQEIFMNTFYSNSVWRQPDESMQAYTIRRRKEFDRPTKVTAETVISEDIMAFLLLNFSGLSEAQQAGILSSTANKFELTPIEQALRIQYSKMHMTQRRAPQPRRGHYQERHHRTYAVPPDADEYWEDYDTADETQSELALTGRVAQACRAASRNPSVMCAVVDEAQVRA